MQQDHCWSKAGQWLLPLLVAFPLLLVLIGFDADRSLSDLFFDTASRRFLHKHDWWLTWGLHDGAKLLVITFAAGLVACLLVSLKHTSLARRRKPILLLLASMLLTTLVVAVIKHFSYQACPSDLLVYGGSLPRIGLFDAVPEGATPGRCWPGGHSSTAFSLFCLYFAARQAARCRLARILLVGVLLFGIVLSLSQVMRGAHFLSHQVWTALICWYLTAGLYWAAYRTQSSAGGRRRT